MKTHARVVVIGGGVIGCSVLYHLAKHGWTDVVLVERSELTSGSTWHAAGGMHTINGDPNVAKLQKYTIDIYREIEELSGQATGLHMTGGVMLAATRDRFEFIKGLVAKGRYLGIEAEIISPEEAHALMPLLDPKCFVGGMQTFVDGHIDPSGVTHAYARSARKLGAEVYRETKVESLSRTEGGEWRVITNRGEIRAEHVVNAAGLWAREVGRMVGLELPVLAMEHMYLLTEDMPEVAAINESTGKEVIHVVDFDGELYLRQERGRHAHGDLREGVRPLVGPRDAMGLRPRAPPRGHRPDRAFARSRLRALPGIPERGDQADRERAVHLRPGRQPPHRAGPGTRRVLGRLRGDGRLLPGGRGRPLGRELDDRRGPGLGRVSRWMSPASATGPPWRTPTTR